MNRYQQIKKIQRNVKNTKKYESAILYSKKQVSNITKKIKNTIKKYHDKLLQKHSNVNKILQFLRRDCQFCQMKQQIETKIKQCFNCQQNKYNMHTKYNEIQYNASSNSS